MVPVLPVPEMARRRPVAETALAVLLAVAARVGVDIAAAQLSGDLAQQLVHIIAQLTQLGGGGDTAGKIAAPVHPQRQVAGLCHGLVLHGLEDLRLVQQQSGALQRLFPLLFQIFGRHVPVQAQNLVPGREIQHPGGFNIPAEVLLPLFLQGKEVQQHLNVQAHADIGQVKFLFAGFVIHHPDVQLVILDPAVHPVHLAPYPQLAAGLGDGHRRQRPVLPTEGQFKGHGNEVGVPQFLRHLVNDGIGRGPQPLEKIPEPGTPVLEVVQFPGYVLVDILPHQLVQPVVVHGGKAPLGQHIPGHTFQQVMEEGADLGRVKGRRFPGLGPKTVFHEIGKVAGPQPFQPGGGHGDAFSINRLHGLRR